MRFNQIVGTALVSLLLLFVVIAAQTISLVETYAKGSIVLQNSAGYGEKTDWSALFYNTFTDIVAASDSSVFAASSRQHKIFKFDAAGNLIKTFGQDGQGPGEINNPGDPSIRVGSHSISFGEATTGKIHIVQGYGGSLIVGNSMSPELKVYDTAGNRSMTISLNMDPFPVTKQFIRDYKKKLLDNLHQESSVPQRLLEDSLKALEKADISHFFGDHLPFYNSTLADEEGNILIFTPGICLDSCPITVRIYSGSGEYCCEMEIKPGDYELIIDYRHKHLCFMSAGLIVTQFFG